MIRAAIKVHQVACFHSETNWPMEESNTATGIEHSVRVSGEIIKGAADTVIRAEVEETTLGERKHPDRSAGRNLRTKQTVQQAEIGRADRYCSGVGAGGSKALREVIGQLALELHIRVNVEAKPSAHAPEIGVARIM